MHCLNFNDKQICVTPIGSFKDKVIKFSKIKFEKLFLNLMIVRKNSYSTFEATLKILFSVNQKTHQQPHSKHISFNILQKFSLGELLRL
jgi:hypothetical protein